MVSSQDTAVAAALTELGEKIDPIVDVVDVTPGLPADGKLEVRDVLIRVGDTEITERRRTSSTPSTGRREGEPVTFVVRREDEAR